MPRARPGQGAQLRPEPKRLPAAANGRQPVPPRLTRLGLLVALLVMTRLPKRVPKPSGRNVIVALHVAPGASTAPHVLLVTKSIAEEATLKLTAGAEPTFWIETDWLALVR